MAISNLERDIGALQADVRNLVKCHAAMQDDIKAMRSSMDQMKGGKAALFGLLSLAGGIGALATQALHWFRA